MSSIEWASLLPAWRSHKIVKAAAIASFAGLGPDGKSEVLTLVLDRRAGRVIKVAVPPEVFARGRPAVGDYLVVYDDDYISWSPRGAFEAGYTAVEG